MTSIKQKIGKLLIPKLPMTRENFDRLRFEFNAFRVNWRNRFNPFAGQKIRKAISIRPLSVNLASGPFGQSGWINIDMFRHPNISFTFDCRKKLPFDSESVERIRAEHMVEHLDIREETLKFLRECHRVLKKGSVLRIVVPDVAKFAEAYIARDKSKWLELGWDIDNLPSDFDNPIYILNHVIRQDGEHKFGYDFEALQSIVRKAGFSEIIKQSFGVSSDPLLCADLENHKNYSLYVDCIK